MGEELYYFNARGAVVWTNPDNIVDNNLGTFGYTNVNGQAQLLTGNTCPGTDLGTIAKVELRLFGYGDGDDKIVITPVFSAGDGNPHETVPVVSPGDWTAYVDITNDTNHPDWSLWSHIQTLDCKLAFAKSGKGNTVYCSKVEIRVTHGLVDIGADPIDRASAVPVTGSYTFVDKNNPANASGTLHSVKVYANVNMTGFRVGTFYLTNGNTLKCRDSVLIGDVEAGAERTFTELSITVQTGDYIGCYFSPGGKIENDTEGYAGYWYFFGELIDPNDEGEYVFNAGYAISLYGYGDIGAVTKTKTYTLTSRLFKQNTKDYTLAARLAIAQSKDYTLTARLKAVQEQTYTLAARLLKVQSKTYTTTAKLVERLTKTYTTGALLFERQTKTYALAVRLVKVQTKSYTLAAILVHRFVQTYTLAARLFKRELQTYTLAAKLTEAATKTKTYTLAGRLVETCMKAYTLVAKLLKRRTGTYTLTARLVKTQAEAFSLAAWLFKTAPKTYTLAARLVGVATRTYTLAGRLTIKTTRAYDLTARLVATQVKTYGLSAGLLGTQTKAYTLDAWLITYEQWYLTQRVDELEDTVEQLRDNIEDLMNNINDMNSRRLPAHFRI